LSNSGRRGGGCGRFRLRRVFDFDHATELAAAHVGETGVKGLPADSRSLDPRQAPSDDLFDLSLQVEGAGPTGSGARGLEVAAILRSEGPPFLAQRLLLGAEVLELDRKAGNGREALAENASPPHIHLLLIGSANLLLVLVGT